MSLFNKKPGGAPKTYHCGTLTYTKAGLFAVFAWLLWGDFCLTLMETVVPTVLPLKLKALGCSNAMMGVILATIPSILNIGVNPYVSFKSDRFRSRWGRRLPFIIATL
ncbi:MAG: MFS transporter, partial [Terrimicrobiaceae bacterium]